jgi:hypothetical protein
MVGKSAFLIQLDYSTNFLRPYSYKILNRS